MKLNLTNLLASQITNYVLHDENFSVDSLKKINFVTAANGLFRVEKTDTGIFKNQISTTASPIPGLLEMEAGVELLIPRIPFKYLSMALSFYRYIYDRDHTEASLLFFWNKDNKKLPETYSDGQKITGFLVDGPLVIYVPKQVNSSTLSEFHMDNTVQWLRDNLSLLAETHSHHTMKAFFSSTDDANENATQFYGVWGEILNDQPAFAFRYCSGSTKQQITPDVLFEWPLMTTTTTVETNVEGMEPLFTTHVEEELYAGPFIPTEDFPSKWISNVKKKEYTPTSVYKPGQKSYSTQIRMDELDYELLEHMMTNDGMEFAKPIHFFSDQDKVYEEDIANNIADLAGEYKMLGFDNAIETRIKEQYHALN